MTCIVALEFNNKVYMGGDSAAVSGWDIDECSNKKVFINNNFIIGYTSSFRMGQLLQYNLSVNSNINGIDDMSYLIRYFIPEVRRCLADGGYTRIDSNREDSGFFLIGYNGKAYKVSSDFSVVRSSIGFCSVGCGDKYALASMATQTIINPEAAIIKALEISGKFSNGVEAPYYVMSL